MFTHIKHFTHTEKIDNEDAYGFGESFLFVLDGASGLGKRQVMHARSDAHWFAASVGRMLAKALEMHEDPVQALKEILQSLREQYQRSAKEKLSKAETPSACIALFYESGEELCFFGMGDSCGVVEKADGRVEVISDPVLEALDQRAIEEMQRISHSQGISLWEARKQIQGMLMEHRDKRNQPGGYHALDLEWDRLEEIVVHRWRKSEVRRMLCASDGFYEIMKYGVIGDVPELMDAIEENGERLVRELFAAQDRDAQGIVCPRFKHRDDCTFVYARVKAE